MNQLNQEEKEILDSFNRDQWQSDATPERMKDLQIYGQAALSTDKQVTILISSTDLEELQVKAIEEGIPYQTLITSILHKYISGRLIQG
jgi:predicted DNA binding CopG/RHH family protein